MKIYPIAYTIDVGQFTKKDLIDKKMGGCDAIIIHSVMMPTDGSRCEEIGSLGPNGKPLDDVEIFKSWIHLADILSGSETLNQGAKELCSSVFEYIKTIVTDKTDKETH